MVRAVLEAGCSLKVLIVREHPTTEPVDFDFDADFAVYTVDQIRTGGLEVL